jgi:radical SAM-linked protein
VRGDTGFPVRLRFAKRGKVRFVSHRDLARTFERAFRVAALPLAFTQGFSPRPKVSLGLALGVGHESDAEYLDLELVEPIEVDVLPAALGGALPEGVEVNGVAQLVPRAPALQEAITTVEYHLRPAALAGSVLHDTVAHVLAADELRIETTRKGRPVVEDLRPGIFQLVVLDDDLLHAEVATKPRGIRPSELLGLLHRVADVDHDAAADRVLRTKQWIERDGARHEPLAADRAPRASDDARDMSKGLIDVGPTDHTRDQRGAPAEHGFGSYGAIPDRRIA